MKSISIVLLMLLLAGCGGGIAPVETATPAPVRKGAVHQMGPGGHYLELRLDPDAGQVELFLYDETGLSEQRVPHRALRLDCGPDRQVDLTADPILLAGETFEDCSHYTGQAGFLKNAEGLRGELLLVVRNRKYTATLRYPEGNLDADDPQVKVEFVEDATGGDKPIATLGKHVPTQHRPMIPYEKLPPLPDVGPGEALPLTWDHLTSFPYDPNASEWEPEKELKRDIPQWILDLNGRRVRLVGYILPSAIDAEGRTVAFNLVEFVWGCCFGQSPGLNGVVTVECEPLRFRNRVVVEGVLEVSPEEEQGWIISLYRIKADSVTEPEPEFRTDIAEPPK